VLNQLFRAGIKSGFLGKSGFLLIGLEALLSTASAIPKKDITEDTYHPSIVPDILVAILISSVGILLVVYLVNMG